MAGRDAPTDRPSDPDDRVPMIDGHNDTVLRCTDADRRTEAAVEAGVEPENVPDTDAAFLEGGAGGHLDLPRALGAGLGAGLFATFVPNAADPAFEEGSVDYAAGEVPPAVAPAIAREVVLDQLAALHRWDRATDRFRLIGDGADLDACLNAAGEVIGAIPHLEGAAAIAPDLSNLDLLYAAGLRSVGLVWSRPNAFAEGVPFLHDASPDTGAGLTEAGERLVAACNERGMVVDCAHLNAAGFWDVLDASADPPVVSHACAHAICPSSRNLTDEQLSAVGERDGVVGLTFGTRYLHPEGDQEAIVGLDTVVDHVNAMVAAAGIDAVALGSDFDGASITDAIGDVGRLRDLLDALRERGYDETEVEKIAWRNWRRVLTETLDG